MIGLWRRKVFFSQWQAEIVFAVVTILVGGAFLYLTLQIPQMRFGDPVGPRLFPMLVAGGLIVCGGCLLATRLITQRTAPELSQNGDTASSYPFAIAGVLLLLAAYVAAFRPVGFVPSATLFILTVASIFNSARWLANLATAIVFPLALYLTFTRLLGLRLAPGLLPF